MPCSIPNSDALMYREERRVRRIHDSISFVSVGDGVVFVLSVMSDVLLLIMFAKLSGSCCCSSLLFDNTP